MSTFRVGRLHVGLRCSNHAFHDLLRETLAGHLAEHVDAPANYSILLAGDDPKTKDRAFHFLYRGVVPVVRTRDPERLLAGVMSHLAGHLESGPDDDLRLDSLALVRDNVAILVPPAITYLIPRLERRLNASGLRVVDQPWSALDPETAEVVVVEPGLEVAHSARARLVAATPGPRRIDPPVAAGRYRLVGWGFALGDGDSGAIPRSLAVALACTLVRNGHELGLQRTLDGLVGAIRAVQPVGVWAETPSELVASLVALAGE